MKQIIQSECMPGHGVKAALITFMHDFQHDLNDPGISLLVLLDLSAALDAVNHRIFGFPVTAGNQRYYFAVVLLLSEQVVPIRRGGRS